MLAREIGEHAVNEALERTGLGEEISRSPSPAANRRALRLLKTAKKPGERAGKFLRTRPRGDLETTLNALPIAAGSFEEVAEHYE
jgi:hypothetical protein